MIKSIASVSESKNYCCSIANIGYTTNAKCYLSQSTNVQLLLALQMLVLYSVDLLESFQLKKMFIEGSVLLFFIKPKEVEA